MAVPSSSDFNKWDGTKFSDTDWDQNVDKTVEILVDGTYDLNVNQITASTYVGLPSENEVYNINVENGYLYVSNAGNFETEESETTGQSVLVDTTGGSTMKGTDGTTYVSTEESKTTVELPDSDATNPRWDLIEFEASTGTFSVNQGTAEANPTYPTLGANKDPIAYVYRASSTAGNVIYNRNILDARVSLATKNVNGHFKTNFSINQKEDTENSYLTNQQYLQRVPFETKFDYVQEDKTTLQYIDTILVPADPVNEEIVFTGTWGTATGFGIFNTRKQSSTGASSTCVFSFTGVSCNVIMLETSNDPATFKAELSSDGGLTFHSEILIAINQISSGGEGSVHELYQGLEYGDYQVRISNIVAGSTYFQIEAFSYATYLVQTPITQHALQSESPSSIDDVPPLTTLFDGTWSSINENDNTAWNAVFSETQTTSASAEYKFYGSSIYANIYLSSNHDATISVTIDDETTYVKNSSISLPSYDAGKSAWIRLDNGSLPEGVHVVKITTTTATTTAQLQLAGWAHYSSRYPTTCARSLICGKDTYAVSVSDSAFTLNGTWEDAQVDSAFCGRRQSTTTSGDYATITTPTNVKAIYFIGTAGVDKGELKITLGGTSSNIRYINPDTKDYSQASQIQVIYDSYMDNISLDSQELRITNNGSNALPLEGVIFEIGDSVENDSIYCMPKWTRYNKSDNQNTPVSTSHRLDVYGSKSDGLSGRRPMIHSGFVYHTTGVNTYYRNGLNMKDFAIQIDTSSTHPKIYQFRDNANDIDIYTLDGDLGAIATSAFAADKWIRINLYPNRVI